MQQGRARQSRTGLERTSRTDTLRQRQRQRQTERERETDRQTDRQTDSGYNMCKA